MSPEPFEGGHYRVSPGGSLLHVGDDGTTRPVPDAARPAIERHLGGGADQDAQAAVAFPAPSTDVEHRIIAATDYRADAGEQKALRRYTGNGYRGMNGLLRGHLETEMEREHYRPYVQALNQLFEDYPRLPENVTVLRGLTDAGWLPSGDLTGRQIPQKGYVSTSFDPDTADSFASDGAIFEVHVPAGSQALPAPGVFESDEQDEHELVLPHGTIFAVTGDEMRTDGQGRQTRWISVTAQPPTAETARIP